jgi:O-antigen/teichoic acid export membrane protein
MIFETEVSLNQRMARGGAWVFALRIAERVLGLIRIIILARLLVPADFGLLGVALLSVSALESLSQMGFQEALIQKKKDITGYLDTAWTTSVTRGIILFSVLFLSAPYLASILDKPGVTLIIRLIAVSVLCRGFSNIGMVLFRKELDFKKLFAYQFIGSLTNFAAAVTLAFIFRSVWALVFGLLAGNIVQLTISFRLHPYKPRLKFDGEEFSELFLFGKWVLGSSVLVFLITQGDDIFVAKLFGLTALGLYQVAYNISNMPVTELSHVISRVTLPAYSLLQDDLPKLRSSYLNVLHITALISLPAAAGIFILAPYFTHALLGGKWASIVPLLQALSLWGAIRSLGTTTGPVFLGIGKPKTIFHLQLVILGILAALIYPFSLKWGLLGVAVAIIIASLIPNIFSFILLSRHIGLTFNDFAKTLALPAVNTFIMTATVILLMKHTMLQTELSQLFIYMAAGIMVYLVVLLSAERFFRYNSFKEVRKIFWS